MPSYGKGEPWLPSWWLPQKSTPVRKAKKKKRRKVKGKKKASLEKENFLVSLSLPKKKGVAKTTATTAIKKLEGLKTFAPTADGSNCGVKSSGTAPLFVK